MLKRYSSAIVRNHDVYEFRFGVNSRQFRATIERVLMNGTQFSEAVLEKEDARFQVNWNVEDY